MAKKAQSKPDITNSKRIQAHISEGERMHHFLSGLRQKGDNVRKEFVEFINRGSVIDLAIGVAVGGAFNTIVNSFVNDPISSAPTTPPPFLTVNSSKPVSNS